MKQIRTFVCAVGVAAVAGGAGATDWEANTAGAVLELNEHYTSTTAWPVPTGWPILGEVNQYYEDDHYPINAMSNHIETIQWDGDRLGYSGNGAGDVNGDGYADQIINYYFRAEDVEGDAELERRVGRVEVISGADGTRLGEAIIGAHEDIWLAHVMTDIDLRLPHESVLNMMTGELDFDTDLRRKEIVLFANRAINDTTNPPAVYQQAGAAYIYAFFDHDGDGGATTEEKWVNILTIYGDHANSHFGFSGNADFITSINDDDIPDLVVRSRRHNDDTGAVWVFCMPDQNVWAGVDTFPVVITEDDAAVIIERANGTVTEERFGDGGGAAGDIDGDGLLDLVVVASEDGSAQSGGHASGKGAVYGYLSSTDRNPAGPVETFGDLLPFLKLDGSGDAVLDTSAPQYVLDWTDDYDFVINGQTGYTVDKALVGNFDGDSKMTGSGTIGPADLLISGAGHVHFYALHHLLAAGSVNGTLGATPADPQNESATLGGSDTTGWLDDQPSGHYADIEPVDHRGWSKDWALKNAAGDFNLNGSEDVLVHGRSVVSGEHWRHSILVVDFEDALTSESAEVLFDYQSELSWKDTDKMGEDGHWRPLNRSHLETLDGGPRIDASPQNMRAWPAWDSNGDGLNDVLIGALAYSRAIPGVEAMVSGSRQWDTTLDGMDSSGDLAPCEHMVHVHDSVYGTNTRDDSYTAEGDCGGEIDQGDPIVIWNTWGGVTLGTDVRHYFNTTSAYPDSEHFPFGAAGKMYLLPTPAFIHDDTPAVCQKGNGDVVFTVTGGGFGEGGECVDATDITIGLLPGDSNFFLPTIVSVDTNAACSSVTITITPQSGMLTTPREVTMATATGDMVVTVPIHDGTSASYSMCGTIRADVNGDGAVDASDIAEMIRKLGAFEKGDADINGDGVVDSDDLELLLKAF